MDLNLAGKQALVCGSSKGIGLAVAQTLSDLGALVILVGRSQDSLLKAQATIEGESLTLTVDLSQTASRMNLIKRLIELKIKVDILV